MTDNEIVKALMCCNEAQNCTSCKFEPTEYPKGTVGCCDELMKNAIDLIKRQQAEIERLKNVPPFATVVFDKNDIRNILAEKFGDIETTIKEMRSEAITEFVERLKRKSELLAPSVYAIPYRAVSVEDIDMLAKEMTEG